VAIQFAVEGTSRKAVDRGYRVLVRVGIGRPIPRVTLRTSGFGGLSWWGRAAIDALLEEVHSGLDRVEPADLAAEVAAGALVIDTRPIEQRQRDGEVHGALIIDRNVLEWRLDPTCPHHIAEADSANLRMIIVCDEGYSSSLAAASLRQLGIERATDLIGGFQAWKRFCAQAQVGAVEG
jgi:rhodanese-related sulfurtransferase